MERSTIFHGKIMGKTHHFSRENYGETIGKSPFFFGKLWERSTIAHGKIMGKTHQFSRENYRETTGKSPIFMGKLWERSPHY